MTQDNLKSQNHHNDPKGLHLSNGTKTPEVGILPMLGRKKVPSMLSDMEENLKNAALPSDVIFLSGLLL